MAPDGALYLGLDSSTQSLSAVVLEASGGRHRVVCELSLPFDKELRHYGTRHGVLPHSDPSVAQSSPVMWAEALDRLFGRLADQRLELARLTAISGSAQQHGSVYLNDAAGRGLESLHPGRAVPSQIVPLLSRPTAPIWMDSSTPAECREIEAAVGGAAVLAQHTGSRAFERFTGPQIRRFAMREPAAYAATDRIHLVSSFLASVLVGRHAPVDPGDGAGMNLMDLAAREWWMPAVDATAPGLRPKLPVIAPSSAIAGRLSSYWRSRFRLPNAKVAVWSGDNPCSLIGLGLVREGQLGVSLGTSDTIFGPMRTPRVDPGGTGHVFGAPTGEFMGITVFSNGSLARERVRDQYGLTWEQFSRALEATPPGNGGALMLPWFVPEITPMVATPGVRRQGLDEHDAAANVRAVVEAQMTALALHSHWMGVQVDAMHVTGGAAANRQILQVLADVFGAEVRRVEVENAAALGAALRALHADRLDDGDPLGWDEVIAGLEQPPPERVAPVLLRHDLYLAQRARYAQFEGKEYARAGGGEESTRP
ncbi:MAG TPA: FGGY-family carbohydrate kinase [Vicinamibacterales bacterium]|nr:FGGY-family carbohydrate kinase [Vicinamibacterales bacterium]